MTGNGATGSRRDDPVRWGKWTVCPRCIGPIAVGVIREDGNTYHHICRVRDDLIPASAPSQRGYNRWQGDWKLIV